MKKKGLLLGMILLSVVGISGCSSKRITGEYIGKRSTLTIRADKTWRYYYEGLFETIEFAGDYKSVDSNTYKLESDDIILYADVEDNNDLFVYSDDQRHWSAETFRKIGNN